MNSPAGDLSRHSSSLSLALPDPVVSDVFTAEKNYKPFCLSFKNRKIYSLRACCHDSIFYKYSDALCTTLIAKDRVLGHNPAAAIYQMNAYYSKLMK